MNLNQHLIAVDIFCLFEFLSYFTFKDCIICQMNVKMEINAKLRTRKSLHNSEWVLEYRKMNTALNYKLALISF